MDTREYQRMCIDWIIQKQDEKIARELAEAIILVAAAFSIFFITLLLF